MLKILSLVGTRPEIIKTLAFCRAAKSLAGVELRVAYSSQNFGRDMADRFWEELGIPMDRVNPSVDRSSPGSVAKSLVDFTAGCLRDFKPDVLLSNTDTDTAFYSALAAARARVPVAHIEGGIRCEARLNPEELNRRLADHLATWVFVIGPDDAESLAAEGFSRDMVFDLGDITLDSLQIVLREHGIPVRRGDYDLLTIHRQENAGDPKRLSAILEGVRRAGQTTVFPVHPRTRQALEAPEPAAVLRRAGNIEVREPQGYLDMVRLAAGCRKIVSDSGGLRREGYMLGKPVISLVWFVWFKAMNRLGFERVCDADPEALSREILGFDPPGPRPPLFGDGHAGRRILEKIASLAARP